ncbi:MAG: UDP-2,3-diacylglucosamine diphosphatase LpxI [Rubellimicrobium sp.]|nr:UDP-2,3-diacylglucosamine diphosphatase LpxI [Rubellimicrobium sp.]
MIALIAGTGDLPGVLAARLVAAGTPPVICALRGFSPDVPPGLERLDFRLETFGTLLADLRARGVTQVCLVGLVRRPEIAPEAVDAATAPLLAALRDALPLGDDGTLRAIIALIEAQGFAVIGAAAIAPDLVAAPGTFTRRAPGAGLAGALPLARATLAAMGRADSGQALVLRAGRVIAREGPEGTDALLAALPAGQGGFLFKGPKPGQELRADMPAIGPETARGAIRAGLAGIAVVAGGTLVIGRADTVALLDAAGLWLEGVAP